MRREKIKKDDLEKGSAVEVLKWLREKGEPVYSLDSVKGSKSAKTKRTDKPLKKIRIRDPLSYSYLRNRIE
jgi:hypothetical protein